MVQTEFAFGIVYFYNASNIPQYLESHNQRLHFKEVPTTDKIRVFRVESHLLSIFVN
jgi:hypothetical protein